MLFPFRAVVVWFPLLLVPHLAGAVSSNAQDLLRMSEQLDKADASEFKSLIQRADECSRRWDFSCAQSHHDMARKLAFDDAARRLLTQSRQLLDSERQSKRDQEVREERRREAEERAAIERQRRLDEREAALARAESSAAIAAHLGQALAGVRNYANQSGAQLANATANFERQRMALERDRERENARIERERESRERRDREARERENRLKTERADRPSRERTEMPAPSSDGSSRTTVLLPAPQVAPIPQPSPTPPRSGKLANANGQMKELPPDTNCRPGAQYAIACDTRAKVSPESPGKSTVIASSAQTKSGNSGPQHTNDPGTSSGGGNGNGGNGGGSGSDTLPAPTPKHGYIYDKVVAVGEWKDCESTRESARNWAKRSLDSDAIHKCQALGPGWGFAFEYNFLGYEGAVACKDGKSWRYKFEAASAKCRKWQ